MCLFLHLNKKKKKEGKKEKEKKRKRTTWSLTAFPLKSSGKKKHFTLRGYPNKLLNIKYVGYDFA